MPNSRYIYLANIKCAAWGRCCARQGGTMGVPRPASPPAAQHGTSIATVFGGLMLGMLLSSSSTTIVAPAMPRIVADLGGLEHYSWIAVSALLSSTIVV